MRGFVLLLVLCGAGIVAWNHKAQVSAADDNAKDTPASAAGLWTLDKGLAQPESAYYDPTSNVIYVSNVQGVPNEKDGKGYISRVGLDGKLLTERWVDGLNAPKGMRSLGNQLFVTDIDAVVTIDIKAGKITNRLTIEGAKFLNDIAIDGDGTLYVSDMLASTVHQIKNSKATLFLTAKECPHPNGLLVHDNELIVASWGEELDPNTFGVKKLGKLLSFTLTDNGEHKAKQMTELTKQPLGNLDGLENDGSGGYYVSDWIAGKVWHVTADGNADLILQGLKNSADIGLIESKSMLLVPRMGEDKLTAYDLNSL
jgi:sugar lactone lactonase YvrE